MDTIKEFNPAFGHKEYLFRRKVLVLFGGAFHVYDELGNPVFYSRQKAFKVREDFRVYSDEKMDNELLKIKTPHVFDFGAVYYVQDSTVGKEIGAIKRKAFRSILKDEWTFLSPDEREIGKLTEVSWSTALLSRVINLVPQTYMISDTAGRQTARLKRHFNPFVLRFTLKIIDPEPTIDPRLLIAAGILMCGIERRQS